jgi:mevalonate kinase
VDFSIENPYGGGFGYSAAEYWAATLPDLLRDKPHFSDILSEYRKNHNGSGIDLAFQYFGRVCLADQMVQFYQNFNWHFENLDFAVLRTGFKVPTHEHINQLERTSLKTLPDQSEKVIQAFSRNREFEFLAELRKWADLLQSLGLTTEKSIILRNEIEKFPAIKLAKPCGALGADVILIFFAKSQRASVSAFLQERHHQPVAYSEDLSPGLQLQISQQGEKHVD